MKYYIKEFLAVFTWKNEYELGIRSIDDQHKKMLYIGNQISSLLELNMITESNYDEILDIIYELKAYTIYHFKTEEELLIKYHYPDYDQHVKEHESFIIYLNSIKLHQCNENYEDFLKELLNSIMKWIYSHIITTDFLYKNYLINHGVN